MNLISPNHPAAVEFTKTPSREGSALWRSVESTSENWEEAGVRGDLISMGPYAPPQAKEMEAASRSSRGSQKSKPKPIRRDYTSLISVAALNIFSILVSLAFILYGVLVSRCDGRSVDEVHDMKWVLNQIALI